MENELVIFEDLPSKKTPLNAYNLNHNFDVFKNQTDKATSDVATALENVNNAKTELESSIQTKTTALEENITSKTNELEQNITKKTTELEESITTKTDKFEQDINEQISNIGTLTEQLEGDISTKTTELQTNITKATEELQEKITTSTATLENDITTKTNKLEENITTKTTTLEEQITASNEELTGQITKATEDLKVEIGKQIASISTLSIQIVDTLPTEHISGTTIYLIKPGNLSLSATNISTKSSKNNTSAVQIYDITGAKIQSIASITDDDYYLACFYVSDKWVVVGNTKIDLSQYPTIEAMNSAIASQLTEVLTKYALKSEIPNVSSFITKEVNDLTNYTTTTSMNALLENKANVSDIPTSVSELDNDSGYLTEETDPTIPSHVKGITTQDIANWNGKATQQDIDSAISKAITQVLEASY